jgi:hypothetical protein
MFPGQRLGLHLGTDADGPLPPGEAGPRRGCPGPRHKAPQEWGLGTDMIKTISQTHNSRNRSVNLDM